MYRIYILINIDFILKKLKTLKLWNNILNII